MGRGSGNATCSKVTLIILNSIFLIMGLGVLALGIYLKLDKSYAAVSDAGASPVDLNGASIAIIIIGVVIVGRLKALRAHVFVGVYPLFVSVKGITGVGMLGACFEIKCLVILVSRLLHPLKAGRQATNG